MQKRLVLTSLVAVWCACPIFAARGEDGGEAFPTDGYMLENKTYADAATYDNMGTYDGTVTATAEYEDILYQIGAGTYLPAGGTVAEQCPANSYCPGIADATYNESTAQGATSCPSGYPNSDAGASTDTQCYTACTVGSANIAHATAVSGNDYFGAGVDTCVATACENGYHAEDPIGVVEQTPLIEVVEQTPLIDVDYTVAGNDYGFRSADDSYFYNSSGLTERGTWRVIYNYGIVYGRTSCQATPNDPGLAYILANKSAILDKTASPDTVRSDLTPIVGVPKANYMADVVAGIADGSLGEEAYYEALRVVFGLPKDASFSTTDTGQWCYCQMTGFREAGATERLEFAEGSAPWVFRMEFVSADVCVRHCAAQCGHNLRYDDSDDRVFRGAVLGALGTVEFGTCAANEITINWTDATAADIAANNAGMSVYDGDIRTPVRAVHKPGKTFVGWEFIK